MLARAVTGMVLTAALRAQPAFEVATVKRNADCDSRELASSPGRLELTCVTLRSLIRAAYGAFRADRLQPQMDQVIGGPAWLDTERYDVTAKAESAVPIVEIMGPMLQSLIHERFRLRTRREQRETPVYALSIGKGGPRLAAPQEGKCTPIDLAHLPQ